MRILSLDIATQTGWAFGTELGIEDFGSFSCKKFCEAYNNFSRLIDLWKPEIIITATPTRYFNVVRKLSEITGVMLLIAERKGIKVEKNLVDSSCKKVVLGSGKATKKDICAYYKTKDEDAADACLFIDWYIKTKL